ncbi:MAG TPA: amidohydrolase family protein [Thermomicrobiales bacterium]
MIVDAHAHIFPFLGRTPGVGYLRYLQRGLSGNHQPVRRTADNAVVPHPIWATDDPSQGGYQEVNFRVGRFGRFEWTKDGVDYYKQYMPPSLVDNACTADYLVAEMDYAGVDRAVLQNDHYYGSLNDLFADAVRRYPDRFLGTAHIDETTIGTDVSLASLNRAAHGQGLRGIFYDSRDSWNGTTNGAVDEPWFDRFWDEVERLRLVVYWAPNAPPGSGVPGYLRQLRRWLDRLQRNPGLTMVLAGGLPLSILDAHPAALPQEILALVRSGNVCYELCYPISVGGSEEYPYPRTLERVRRLYQECGPASLVWGSDMPNVLRHCTYTQALNHIRLHADFIPPADLDLVLGGNLVRLFEGAGRQVLQRVAEKPVRPYARRTAPLSCKPL